MYNLDTIITHHNPKSCSHRRILRPFPRNTNPPNRIRRPKILEHLGLDIQIRHITPLTASPDRKSLLHSLLVPVSHLHIHKPVTEPRQPVRDRPIRRHGAHVRLLQPRARQLASQVEDEPGYGDREFVVEHGRAGTCAAARVEEGEFADQWILGHDAGRRSRLGWGRAGERPRFVTAIVRSRRGVLGRR
ncbi:hypothetical protein EJ04DRAFT_129126 [Polyplosphaeria fusca]|uniref:Uncharacterized protein n=1 Tax=Polyplosphaeria fusca TaxID=682080 RepID=A0A9P4QK04_9PLEO|nr:hypothetical protein EJ04DRAFT_129126 [Polyplosphaeria fusca]